MPTARHGAEASARGHANCTALLSRAGPFPERDNECWRSSGSAARGFRWPRTRPFRYPMELRLIVDDDHERRSGSDAATSAMAASNSPDATIDFAHSPMTGSRPFETNVFETTSPRRRRAARTERASCGGNRSRSTVTAANVLRISQGTGCAGRGERSRDDVRVLVGIDT